MPSRTRSHLILLLCALGAAVALPVAPAFGVPKPPSPPKPARSNAHLLQQQQKKKAAQSHLLQQQRKRSAAQQLLIHHHSTTSAQALLLQARKQRARHIAVQSGAGAITVIRPAQGD